VIVFVSRKKDVVVDRRKDVNRGSKIP
jgi:hypothetical protein